ncbi:uncharacterized protein N7446_010720 [Penicillium canescens]|uniref:Uncharacterized protein n=1 Tax=Penicillium canescens TaxID=5083 RepID=A0AAD6IB54_PENCN|nr:uncharacterized protein N7446_010720 [Penicillium canescens]KAJ6041393.1 hypothetical protein N7460_006783 [Penicillium canescens]KAJ6050611.1 hypothetical protein N7446_010720 [Penicillium canescens]KAJ6065830.1 hypothetical protein N7444_001483 [Penicillium canescens]
MIQSTVVLVGFLKQGRERDSVPLLVEQSAAFDGLKRKASFRVVGGFFGPMNHWCIMVFYEGLMVGDPAVEVLRQYLATFCLDSTTYEHIEPIAEPLFSETGQRQPVKAWKRETLICYLKGSTYRLMWDGVAHFENTKLYASAVYDALELFGGGECGP